MRDVAVGVGTLAVGLAAGVGGSRTLQTGTGIYPLDSAYENHPIARFGVGALGMAALTVGGAVKGGTIGAAMAGMGAGLLMGTAGYVVGLTALLAGVS